MTTVEGKLTLRDIQEATGAPAYTIQYLKSSGRLPIAQKSKGQGYPVLYHHKAIDVVAEHLKKQVLRR